ncbi:MAG: hypothetical protein HUU28_14815 [Planctomycetaceae bacterium]|nr:hypothetical protein [Planctomycetaceae bacterium]
MLEFDRWLVVAALCLGGCSDPDRIDGSAKDSGSETLVDTGAGDADSGKVDTGVTDTGASDADGGETAPLVGPTTGMAIVPGGVRMTNDKYILVTTTTGMSGGFASSSAYVLHGGVVGAVESSR